MDEHLILTREEALDLLDLLWVSYELAVQSLQQVEAMRLWEMIEEIEVQLWG